MAEIDKARLLELAEAMPSFSSVQDAPAMLIISPDMLLS
jgi:hypothetical protein